MGIPCATSGSACCNDGRQKSELTSCLSLHKDPIGLPPRPPSSFSKKLGTKLAQTAKKGAHVAQEVLEQKKGKPPSLAKCRVSTSADGSFAEKAGECEVCMQKTMVNSAKQFISHASNMRARKGVPSEHASPDTKEASKVEQSVAIHSGSTLRSSVNANANASAGIQKSATKSAKLSVFHEEVSKSEVMVEVKPKHAAGTEPIPVAVSVAVPAPQPKEELHISLVPAEEKKMVGASRTDVDPTLDFTKKMMSVMSMIVPAKGTSTRIDMGSGHHLSDGAATLEEQYQIMCKLDGGMFGEVSKITDRTTGAVRALKTLSKAKCQMTEKFQEEIQLLKKLVPHQKEAIE